MEIDRIMRPPVLPQFPASIVRGADDYLKPAAKGIAGLYASPGCDREFPGHADAAVQRQRILQFQARPCCLERRRIPPSPTRPTRKTLTAGGSGTLPNVQGLLAPDV
jgi:hypothetical protein